MAAIGVERHIYAWIDGWKDGSVTVDRHYIDPTVLPSAVAYALYGSALSRQYLTDGGVVVGAMTLPDCGEGCASKPPSSRVDSMACCLHSSACIMDALLCSASC